MVALSGGTFLIAVYGEMDLSTVEEFDRQLRRAEASDAREIIVDLSALRFIDSTGVRALLIATERSRVGSDRLRILRGPDPVQRVFGICGLVRTLPFLD